MVTDKKNGAGTKPARTATRDHQKSGSPVSDAAQVTVERSFAQYVREQPLKSILIAAGVGLVLGRFWLRR
jgi:ElaB/YqjD/DUF883 family membrane-anchored ribosome-binding protein